MSSYKIFDNGIYIRKTLTQVNFLCWLVSDKTILNQLIGACVDGSLEKSICENSRFTETKILYSKNVSDK